MTDTNSLRDEPTLRLVRDGRDAPPLEPKPERGSASLGRVLGLDLARALAVFGMFYSHVGPRRHFDNPVVNAIMEIPHGRSAALFAVLAGLSLVLLAGGRRPRPALERRRRIVRIVIRSLLLIALGSALTAAMGVDIIILAFYGLYFLLALPFIRCGTRTLAILSAAVAAVGSVVFYWFTMARPGWISAVDALDPLARAGADGIVSLLFTGFYPAFPWLAYIFAGMAIGKLDLSARRIRFRLAWVGAGLAAFGYGFSWVLRDVVFAAGPAMAGSGSWSSGSDMSSSPGSSGAMVPDGVSPWSPDMLRFLLESSPHSGTMFELTGNIGIAMLVITACVALLDRSAPARKLLTPITAVGAMSLTLYVAHLWGIGLVPPQSATSVVPELRAWAWFCLAAVAFAFLWSRFFKRGPLEHLMHWATGVAKFVR
ncbi:heparan-alpha-glucosaminide N-acetyltransferase domain-containing protein [Glycomyces terrestris]|uniref:DUF1624 domain-containing protein n=1 Tax=Glycomyces terrestris TaxID=2493553 RepID=A0A426V0M6_9ACTN|nr:heparan-alpha-glucosaminide N-acetyltransferase domain-containing protein [Glycomyces terrestris]RRS00438.1 DUF1624 domain-containing protein [Glycomyces terrestris]